MKNGWQIYGFGTLSLIEPPKKKVKQDLEMNLSLGGEHKTQKLFVGLYMFPTRRERMLVEIGSLLFEKTLQWIRCLFIE